MKIKMKWSDLCALLVLCVAVLLAACGEDGLGSTSGAGGGTTTLEINGDSNNICFIEAAASEEIERIEVDCNDLPIQQQGTSQFED